ncbi:helix-turn-helix domain-containing protein [Pedobacter duraquae]|uniref:DNA-binding XRE family transcriptional regulator n=1 Tax=Pedobacter duraquae TaxID=425511 RepID=A0A4R6IRB1_9SPHI|nr:helix-turn-helix transcriptional regulator [Pedobacter duraquae]TDO24960.1 DNA-binding XRE family transcriptional regulator [Pedobacter duraquae]
MKKGKILKDLRRKKGITQEEISGLLEVTRTTYCKWENDKVDLTISQAVKLAAAYGLKASILVQMFEAESTTTEFIKNFLL